MFRVAAVGDEKLLATLRLAARLADEDLSIAALEGEEPASDVYVVGPSAEDAFRLASDLQRQAPHAQMLFLVGPDRLDRVRTAFPFVPHLAAAWAQDVGTPPAALADLLLDAARAARQRATAATLRERINQHLTITARREPVRRAQDQLSISGDFLATLLAQAPDAIVALAPDQSIVALNLAATRLFGVRAEEAESRQITDVVPAEMHASIEMLVSEGLGGRALTGAEVATRYKDREVWIELSIAPVKDAFGRIISLSLTARDVTERVAARQVLARSREDLEREVATRTLERDRVWSATRDLFVICSRDGRIVSVNPAWSRTLGWDADDLVGTSLFDMVSAEDQAAARVALGAVRDGRSVANVDLQLCVRDGGHRWFAWDFYPAEDQCYGAGRDVDERKLLEEQLRQSQKMEAVGQLTGGLAHDFNNLLTGITGSLELLQNRVRQGRTGEIDKYIDAAQTASRRAASLTHRLLAFSRRQTLDPRATEINRLVAGMEELVRRTMGPSIALEVVGAAGLWTAMIDPNQLENALLNLCVNARDAMPDGGRLTIETANKWLDDRGARERDLPPGQYLSVCVTDTGMGMPPDVVRRAFDPFYTTKPLGEGTGLGLSMVYGFARQSGGQVRIYSELGRGTTVCIYLPRHYGEAALDVQPAAPGPLRTEVPFRVLIVDDEPTIRMLDRDVLEELGYGVVEAEDGPSAMKVLNSPEPIDLLVTDVGLPNGMNGRQVADAARSARPGLKVLFITGYAENAVIANGYLAPDMQVLTKPFTMEDLASRMRDLLSASQ